MHCRTREKLGFLKFTECVQGNEPPAIHHMKMSRKDPISIRPRPSTSMADTYVCTKYNLSLYISVGMHTISDKFMYVLYKSFIFIHLVEWIVQHTQTETQ